MSELKSQIHNSKLRTFIRFAILAVALGFGFCVLRWHQVRADSLTSASAVLTDNQYSSPSGLTLSFTTATIIPAGGDILITIPTKFDLNGISSADISTSGCTDANWSPDEFISPGGSVNQHSIVVHRLNNSCPAGSRIVITIDEQPGVITPAKIASANAQAAQTHRINIKTRSATDSTLDLVDVQIALTDGVIVSATILESLTFSVAGVSQSNTIACTPLLDVSTTSTEVPFGSVQKPNTFLNAAQVLTVSTNASSGYSVTTEENDQLARTGITCHGKTATDRDNCIKDTVCDNGACQETVGTHSNWINSAVPGFGFSLKNQSGADAVFEYNRAGTLCKASDSRLFCARQFPDQEAGEERQVIMTRSSPTENSSVYICYRLSVPPTQPAGEYSNTIIYTAVAKF